MGSIGKLMEGSGIADVLQCCYGSVTVGHMLTGKAEARAVRGHILVQSALYVLLFEIVFKNSYTIPADHGRGSWGKLSHGVS